MGQSVHNLLKNLLRSLLRQISLLLDKLEEIASVYVFHNKEEVLGGLEHFIQADNV